MLRELHWLPIKARIEYKLALTCFKSKSGNYPSYISDLLVPYTPSRSLRSSSSSNFSIPHIHLKGFGERAFTFSGPSVWNALPQELKSCSTLGHFKKQMKTHLFRKYLNWLVLPFQLLVFFLRVFSSNGLYAWHMCLLMWCANVRYWKCIYW